MVRLSGATLYDGVGAVKRHVDVASREGLALFLLRRSSSFIFDQGSLVNRAVDSGSTNHLFGHSTSDHDSFFRHPDHSGEQGAQSA